MRGLLDGSPHRFGETPRPNHFHLNRRESSCPERKCGNVGSDCGKPEEVRVHGFIIPELGRAVPYGGYDIASNARWVSVGIDHDTAAFAANAIRSWWKLTGRARYPNARSLLITADGSGSNGSRVRLWKLEL
jgi:Rhodopirellula transposase DDE domain